MKKLAICCCLVAAWLWSYAIPTDYELLTKDFGDTETSWHWHPEMPWSASRYILRVSEDLEDLAGNNLKLKFARQPNMCPKSLWVSRSKHVLEIPSLLQIFFLRD